MAGSDLWMTKIAFLIWCAAIAALFETDGHLKIRRISICFILVSLSFTLISHSLYDKDKKTEARIFGHGSLLIAVVTATLLLSVHLEGILRWLPLVAPAVSLFFLLYEVFRAFCLAPNAPNAQNTDAEMKLLDTSTNQPSPATGAQYHISFGDNACPTFNVLSAGTPGSPPNARGVDDAVITEGPYHTCPSDNEK